MRYIVGIFITLGLIVLIFVLLFTGSSAPAAKAVTLADYVKTDSVAQLIIDGPVVADQNHQSVEIDVTASQVTATLYNGYLKDQVRTLTYSNNDVAYTNFLLALQNQGFTKGNIDPKLSDPRGNCPTGQRNIYSFENESKQLVHFWSTSCGAGTAKGKTATITSLFRNQVPEYDDLVKGSRLTSGIF